MQWRAARRGCPLGITRRTRIGRLEQERPQQRAQILPAHRSCCQNSNVGAESQLGDQEACRRGRQSTRLLQEVVRACEYCTSVRHERPPTDTARLVLAGLTRRVGRRLADGRARERSCPATNGAVHVSRVHDDDREPTCPSPRFHGFTLPRKAEFYRAVAAQHPPRGQWRRAEETRR